MKHCKTGRQFGRVRRQRTALSRTMLGSLIMHERIETTQAKAKELKMQIDPVITKAKRGGDDKLTVVRKLEGTIPLMAIKKLMTSEFIERLDKRTSGYTRVIKLPRRKSDGAEMAIIEFIDQKEIVVEKTSQKKDDKKKDEKTTTKKEEKKNTSQESK